ALRNKKLPYQDLPEGVRGNVKTALNAMLAPVGLEIDSKLRQTLERERLEKLRARGHWEQPKYTEGLRIDAPAALAFLQETCLPYRKEYARLPHHPNGDESQFFLDNTWFGSIDAEVLYSVLRRHQSRHVIEVGSGYSTRLIRRAISD